MKLEETSRVVFLGNYFGLGPGYDGAVFDKRCLCPTLMASNANGNVLKFIVEKKWNTTKTE